MSVTAPLGAVVTIIGAGVAGLALAAALAQRGARVQLLEQAETLGEVGAGVQISPNGAVVLDALGQGAALAAAGLRAEAVHLHDGLSGRRLVRLDLVHLRREQPYLFLHRADLIGILHRAALQAGAELHFGQQITGVDLDHNRPIVRMADGEERSCDLLIGADGIRSLTHGALNGVAEPFFTHQAAWRAVIPADADAPPVAEVHMGPGRHVVSYPLRGGALRNLVAVEERAGWLAEGWSHSDDPENLREAFSGFSPRVRSWLARVQEVGLWGLFRHPVARRWQRVLPQGGVAILGDAAHPTLPFLAQGANMALEDAWVLADSLSQGTMTAALADYQVRREARARRIVSASGTNARLYHLHSPWRGPAYLALALAGRVAPGWMVARQDWIWAEDVTERHSPTARKP
jgi:salicylate hydroxylase